MVNRYSRPPWDFLDVPEDVLAREAEIIDLQEELAGGLPEVSAPTGDQQRLALLAGATTVGK